MLLLKCHQTGHFFVHYPENDTGFTCFECFEEFAASSPAPRVPVLNASRKRRSLHGIPVVPHEVPTVPPAKEKVERDETGKRRSRPWRCLQAKCKLLACDACSDKLIDPKVIAANLASSDSAKKGRLEDGRVGRKHMEDVYHLKAGDSTPADERKERERTPQGQGRRPLPKIPEPVGRLMAPAPPPPEPVLHEPIPEESKPEKPPSSKPYESDGSASGSESELETAEDIRTKLTYRRAANVANNALAHYHHRLPGRTMPSTNSKRVPHEHAKKPKAVPVQRVVEAPKVLVMPQEPPPLLAVVGEDVLLEVDSEEEDLEDLPLPAVRSAAEASIKAVRGMNIKYRQRPITNNLDRGLGGRERTR